MHAIRKSSPLLTIALHLLLIALAAGFLLPLAFLICAAFKTGGDLHSSFLLPWRHLNRLTLDNFRQLLHSQPIARWLINTVFVASSFTVLVVLLSSLSGYVLAKHRFRGRWILMFILLATMLLPQQVMLPALYELIARIGWLDSYWAIILPGAVSIFGVFLFRQAMLGVPDELLDAARIDGCGELALWWQIALPLVRPMIGAFTLLSFLTAWNSFLWPQIVLRSPPQYTLPVALANLTGLSQYQDHFGLLMAATLISIAPVILLFFTLQNQFISGLVTGAVKQ